MTNGIRLGNMKGASCSYLLAAIQESKGYYIDLEKSLLAFERENTTNARAGQSILLVVAF